MQHNDNTSTSFKNIFSLILLTGIIALITYISFIPSLSNNFTNWDDDTYVINNSNIKNVSIENVRKIFTSTYLGNYQPLTLLAYMAEYQFFQLKPAGYHSVSLLIHILNSLLVFFLIYYLLKNRFIGLLISVLFAIHPLRVESVAWIAEQKDVLCAFFYFLTLIIYMQYTRTKKKLHFFFSFISFIASLLFKPMSITLPFIILLFDSLTYKEINKKILLSKIPFFAISVLFSIIALFTQINFGTHSESPFAFYDIQMIDRICTPFYGIVFYLFKTAIPFSLSAFYPYPAESNNVSLLLYFSPIIVILISVLFFRFRNIPRAIKFGLVFFFVTLLPVLQIVPIGNTIVAERYTYIPSIGIFFIFSIFCNYLFNLQNRYKYFLKTAVLLFVLLIIIASAFATYNRCKVWKNSETLWSDVIKQFPIASAYNSRGVAYGINGDIKKAIVDFDSSISIKPSFAVAFNNRGLIYNKIGENENAIKDFTQAISLSPASAINYINRGFVYKATGDYNHALSDYSEAIKLNPKSKTGYYNRATIYSQMGDFNNALKDLSDAIRINPEPVFYNNRGLIFKETGQFAPAIEDFTAAIKLDRSYSNAFCNRGVAYFLNGDQIRAIEDLSRALALNPQFVEAYYNRGIVYRAIGNFDFAINDFKTACNMGAAQACKILYGN